MINIILCRLWVISWKSYSFFFIYTQFDIRFHTAKIENASNRNPLFIPSRTFLSLFCSFYVYICIDPFTAFNYHFTSWRVFKPAQGFMHYWNGFCFSYSGQTFSSLMHSSIVLYLFPPTARYPVPYTISLVPPSQGHGIYALTPDITHCFIGVLREIRRFMGRNKKKHLH